jgi:NAD(P)-dependent dehydrogenase (short-subunit alcohol dehydrogenase family)
VKEGVRVVAGAREFDAPMLRFADDAQVQSVAVDLSTEDGPAQLVAEAVRVFGGIDLLVNNVGAVRPRTEGFLSVTDEDWAWALSIDVLVAVRTTRAALPHLLKPMQAPL